MDSDEDNSDIEIKTNQSISTLPWIEKYRPGTLDQILSQDDIIKTLKIFVKNKCLPHMLFYGIPGTGKTSTINACAKELYGSSFKLMVMELNASDDRGIDVVRTKIKQFVMSKGICFDSNKKDVMNMFKLVILDETDAMTAEAQAILRKVIEDFTDNTRFCLICNYIQSITPALQSRCVRFRFAPLLKKNMIEKIDEICEKENIKVTDQGKNVVINRSNGDMRKLLNILQSTSLAYSVINEKNINTCLGYPRKSMMKEIVDNLVNKNFKDCYYNVKNVQKENSLALGDIINELHNMLLQKLTEDRTDNENINKLNNKKIMDILDKMRYIEYNQYSTTTDDLQLTALIGIFKL